MAVFGFGTVNYGGLDEILCQHPIGHRLMQRMEEEKGPTSRNLLVLDHLNSLFYSHWAEMV